MRQILWLLGHTLWYIYCHNSHHKHMTTTPKSMNSYETKQSTSRCHQGVNLTDVTSNAKDTQSRQRNMIFSSFYLENHEHMSMCDLLIVNLLTYSYIYIYIYIYIYKRNIIFFLIYIEKTYIMK